MFCVFFILNSIYYYHLSLPLPRIVFRQERRRMELNVNYRTINYFLIKVQDLGLIG